MRIVSVGGGPAGLYFALLMKQAFGEARIRVVERNKSDDTFGWGVVFSDETLGNFETADAPTYAAIRREFVYWGDIETFVDGGRERSTGHGFCGMSRKKLLQILQARCRELGVELEFEREVTDEVELGSADLVLAADGLNSGLRKKYEAHFKPTIHWGACRFAWLGTTVPLNAFTFIFRANEHGLFVIHAYPFEPSRGGEAAIVGLSRIDCAAPTSSADDEPVKDSRALSTFIVECHETTWRKAGLDRASEADTLAYVEQLFADHLDGHRLLANRSIWRSFPTVACERWSHGNVVLVGDSAHTAHFSIGSGTKLAMEDAIALVDAFKRHGTADVPRALAAYEAERRLDVLKIQRAAKTSREWFENCARYVHQSPLQLQFNLMTRSQRITWDNLALRDPALVGRVRDEFAASAGVRVSPGKQAPPPLFTPFTLRGLTLRNRVVVSPMCQYSAVDGAPTDWHLVHLGSRAVGGAALVFTEMTNVSAEGRITHACAGMYTDEHERAWKRIVEFVHTHSRAAVGMQLAHAGRKGSCNLPWQGDDPLRDASAWPTLAPSADPFAPDWHVPREMTRADMERVRDQFVASTQRCERAGFDVIELHMAHGYLLSSFLSPLSNSRRDEYGGSLANRMRFPLEVFDAARANWPQRKPISVRISATDWLDDQGGFTLDEAVELARALKQRGCDLIDVSTAGNSPRSKPDYGRMYQVPFADRIRHDAHIAVMAVGGIQNADHVNTVIAAGRADLCALARPHLTNPYLTFGAAVKYAYDEPTWPPQYLAVKPQ